MGVGPDVAGSPALPPPCASSPCIGVGEVIVHNVNPTEGATTKLVFGGATDFDNLPATNIDSIVVDLGVQLHALWVAGGQVGSGVHISTCDSNIIVVDPTGGWIGNVAYPADEMDVVNLWAFPSA